MNKKKCPFCKGVHCVKKGFQQGHQRWKCKDCNKKFQANKKAPPLKEELFCLYVFSKQTLAELAQKYHLETKKLQRLFNEIILPKKEHQPRIISLAVDTTFFEDFAVVVFRDQEKQENLWWSFTNNESLYHYAEGRFFLEKLGYVFRSVTGDGLPGLPSVFPNTPFQYCHFHAKKNITRYVTRNPKTDAGIELKYIMDNLKNYNQERFLLDVKKWEKDYEYFLKEKTYHPGGSWSYTHGRLRSAIRSMKKMSGFLFTYQRYSFFIPLTTNTLEGFFTHLKIRVKAHRGISLKKKQKVVNLILLNSSSSYRKDMWKKLF